MVGVKLRVRFPFHTREVEFVDRVIDQAVVGHLIAITQPVTGDGDGVLSIVDRRRRIEQTPIRVTGEELVQLARGVGLIQVKGVAVRRGLESDGVVIDLNHVIRTAVLKIDKFYLLDGIGTLFQAVEHCIAGFQPVCRQGDGVGFTDYIRQIEERQLKESMYRGLVVSGRDLHHIVEFLIAGKLNMIIIADDLLNIIGHALGETDVFRITPGTVSDRVAIAKTVPDHGNDVFSTVHVRLGVKENTAHGYAVAVAGGVGRIDVESPTRCCINGTCRQLDRGFVDFDDEVLLPGLEVLDPHLLERVVRLGETDVPVILVIADLAALVAVDPLHDAAVGCTAGQTHVVVEFQELLFRPRVAQGKCVGISEVEGHGDEHIACPARMSSGQMEVAADFRDVDHASGHG